MISFGIAGKPACSKNLEAGMSQLRKMGLDALEVQFGRGIMLKKDAMRRIAAAARDNGIRLSCHAPYYINFNSLKPETRERSSDWLRDTCAAAGELGADIIVVHAGRTGDNRADASEAIRSGIGDALERLKDIDWNGHIGIETMGKASAWGELEEIKELCALSKRLVPVIDFAHIHALYGGCYNHAKDYEATLSSYEELDKASLHAHFTCIEYDAKGEKKHLPVSALDPDFHPLAKVLKKRKYPIRIICESPMLEQDAAILKQWYERS